MQHFCNLLMALFFYACFIVRIYVLNVLFSPSLKIINSYHKISSKRDLISFLTGGKEAHTEAKSVNRLFQRCINIITHNWQTAITYLKVFKSQIILIEKHWSNVFCLIVVSPWFRGWFFTLLFSLERTLSSFWRDQTRSRSMFCNGKRYGEEIAACMFNVSLLSVPWIQIKLNCRCDLHCSHITTWLKTWEETKIPRLNFINNLMYVTQIYASLFRYFVHHW